MKSEIIKEFYEPKMYELEVKMCTKILVFKSPNMFNFFTTSLKRAVADAEKKEIFGTDKLEEMKNSLQDTDVKNAYESAKIKVDRGEIKPNEVTDRVIKTNTGTLEDEATLLYERGRLKNQELKLLKDRNNSEDANSKNKINDDLMKLYDKLAENDYAAAKIGREASNIFRLRKEYISTATCLYLAWKDNTWIPRGLKN